MSEKTDIQDLPVNTLLPPLPNVFLSFQPQPSSLHNTIEEVVDISPYNPPNFKPPHYQQGGDQYWRGPSSQMRGGNNYYYGVGNNNYYGGNYYNNNYGNRGFHGSGQKQRGGWNDYNNRTFPMKRQRKDHDISAYYKKSFLQDPWQKDKK